MYTEAITNQGYKRAPFIYHFKKMQRYIQYIPNFIDVSYCQWRISQKVYNAQQMEMSAI